MRSVVKATAENILKVYLGKLTVTAKAFKVFSSGSS
jgi:hypothetical protein